MTTTFAGLYCSAAKAPNLVLVYTRPQRDKSTLIGRLEECGRRLPKKHKAGGYAVPRSCQRTDRRLLGLGYKCPTSNGTSVPCNR
nr:MAG TPA: hypothetical protein [Caudoviricetes sp.]